MEFCQSEKVGALRNLPITDIWTIFCIRVHTHSEFLSVSLNM